MATDLTVKGRTVDTHIVRLNPAHLEATLLTDDEGNQRVRLDHKLCGEFWLEVSLPKPEAPAAPASAPPVKAEVHTDNRVHEVDFDAADWFAQASDEEVRKLSGCGWGGDYPADEVALFYGDSHPEVTQLFAYLEKVQGTRRACGFECHVDEASALAWLKENRPTLHAELSGEAEEA
jgi:hypothetical protein